MEFSPTSFKRARAAFTLIEMVVALGVSAILLAAVMSFFFYSNYSFGVMANHIFLQKQNSVAKDKLTKQIRQTFRLTAYTTNSVTFLDYNTNSVQYTYNPSAQTLVRIKQGVTNTYLYNCTYLQFKIYSDVLQSNALDVSNTPTNLAAARVVGIAWLCQKTLLGHTNAEPMQAAKILLRNRNILDDDEHELSEDHDGDDDY